MQSRRHQQHDVCTRFCARPPAAQNTAAAAGHASACVCRQPYQVMQHMCTLWPAHLQWREHRLQPVPCCICLLCQRISHSRALESCHTTSQHSSCHTHASSNLQGRVPTATRQQHVMLLAELAAQAHNADELLEAACCVYSSLTQVNRRAEDCCCCCCNSQKAAAY